MSAITILATITITAAVILPALAELGRIHADRHSPIRALKVATRRGQDLELSTSGC